MSDERSDAALFEAWREGDKRAGNELFERYFEAVRRFFARRLDHGAEDLIQRTFLACTEHSDRLRTASSFRAYLLAIARNELFAHFRRFEPSTDTPSQAALAALADSPSRALATRQEQELLLTAMAKLPLDFQMALELYYWEELSAPELATVLGVPVTTVRGRIRRGKEILEKELRTLLAAGSTVCCETLESWSSRMLGPRMPES